MAEIKQTKTGAIIGLGGLGCPALLSLIKCWPNDQTLNLKLIDSDTVSSSNLNRQILYSSQTVGQKKVDATKEAVKKYFGELPTFISIETIFNNVSPSNINFLLSDCDFILDCTDDVEFKLLVNRYAIFNKKILIYAGVQGFNGTVLPIVPSGPCLNCVFGNFSAEETCELGGACQSGGVLGSIAGITALAQVKELMSYLNIKTEKAEIKLTTIDGKGLIKRLSAEINHNCPNGCGMHPFKTIDLRAFKCPDTFLYAKLALEKLKTELKNSKVIEFKFGSSQDLDNVQQSLSQEGYKLTKMISCTVLSEYKLLVGLANN